MLKNKENCDFQNSWILGILFLFLPLQLLLAQDRWTQVSNPGPLSNSLEVFGETFYKAPNGLLEISKKNATNEIRLPNEKGEEEIFLVSPAPVLSQSLKVKYPSLKTYKGVSKQRPNVRIRLSTQPKKRLYFNKVVTRVVDMVNPNGIDSHDTAIIIGRKPFLRSHI